MLDIVGANIFNVGRGTSTRSLDVNNFMQSMGYDPFDDDDDPVEFKPIEAETEGLDLVDNAMTSYTNSLGRLNAFGMKLAAKGIDPMNPNNRSEEAIRAAEHFQRMGAQVDREAAALKTSLELRKHQNQLLARENVIGKRPGAGLVTGQDTGVINLQTFRNPMEQEAAAINDVLAGEYDTHTMANTANKEIQERKRRIWNHVKEMTDAGIPLETAREEVQRVYDSIGVAQYNPMAERKLAETKRKNLADEGIKRSKANSKKSEKVEEALKGRDQIYLWQQGLDLDGMIGEGWQNPKIENGVITIMHPTKGRKEFDLKKPGGAFTGLLAHRNELVPASKFINEDDLAKLPELTEQTKSELLAKKGMTLQDVQYKPDKYPNKDVVSKIEEVQSSSKGIFGIGAKTFTVNGEEWFIGDDKDGKKSLIKKDDRDKSVDLKDFDTLYRLFTTGSLGLSNKADVL